MQRCYRVGAETHVLKVMAGLRFNLLSGDFENITNWQIAANFPASSPQWTLKPTSTKNTGADMHSHIIHQIKPKPRFQYQRVN